ncbi:nucleotide excision repair endonuclease [Sporosarcina sp. P21c]|uniref:nucleotide excision repair endonuclease n=1 Tax=Sporosarcina TaxID=1569 RepID=UPI000A159564|nr:MULTISPECIES: nucleotide excision repair endonuclease [Sporosarcina]ARJ37765.1 nucleotide excision repair endonuclease [Sporosarcina ureae]PIC66216.1 nucleotide excision repair endonuclease [Sporosarcina sp. P16a]PIC82892.1 nucleotide excision repair endonuclease [Sporosarcina sp. P1]PIC90147.1 nucleotide excision repair endonuclease [Sporosarcina sp. P21c]PIC91890.1 nucleotide excision repair endonuclease [Sporosarcina sp. P25]
MINITLPKPDVTIVRRKQEMGPDETPIKPIYGFIDFHDIPRDKGGLLLFFNQSDELLFVGKARKLRPRLKKHFEDQVSPLRNHREEVAKISAVVIDDPMEREIYETYVINTQQAKYNVEKAFFRD